MNVEFPVLMNNEIITLILDEETAAKGKIQVLRL